MPELTVEVNEMANKQYTQINVAEAKWSELYDFINICGHSHNPRSFAMDVLDNIQTLCPYDQAVVFFLDGNRKACGHELKGIDEKVIKTYLEYYSEIENRQFSLFIDDRENPNQPTINVRDWTSEPSIEFIPNYINPRGLKYSCGFALYDLNGNPRTIFSLDRQTHNQFLNRELYNLQLAVTMLNNLHKNFYYQGFSLSAIKQSAWEAAKLTAREIEIVDLMSQGVSPGNISKILYISQSTTYKHIAHIYEKMEVSSQQELLVKLLRQTE